MLVASFKSRKNDLLFLSFVAAKFLIQYSLVSPENENAQ